MSEVSQPMAHWTLDKRVPVALVMTIVAQTFLAGWYMSAQSARLSEVEERVRALTPVSIRLTVLETKLESIADVMKDIRDDLRANRTDRNARPAVGPR